MSVWLSSTRARLLSFVVQRAKNAGVVKNPTRGMRITRSWPARIDGRSKIGVVASPARGGRTVTMCHDVKSASVM